MNPTSWWPHVGVALIGCGLGGVVYAGSENRAFGLGHAVAGYVAPLDRDLGFIRAHLRGPEVAAVQAVVSALLLVLAALLRQWVVAFLALSILPAPRLWLQRKRAARIIALEDQVAEWLVSVSGALRAGNSLGEALAASAAVSRPPIREEIDVVMREYALGVPLDDALGRLAARIESRTLKSALLVLTVARRTGGDVPETLERAASSLREMARLAGVIRAKTAEGKAQAAVISVMPAPLVALIDWISPQYFAPLTSSVGGYLVIAGAVALWAVAIVAASRIVAVEV